MITLGLTFMDPMENEKKFNSGFESAFLLQFTAEQYTTFDFFFLSFSDFSPIWDMISIIT